MKKSDYDFNEKIHAIIINPYFSLTDFKFNCELIKKYKIKNISTSLHYLKYLKDFIKDDQLKINSFISYPLADLPKNFIKEMTEYAKEKGANGIEYVPKFFFLSENDEESFASDIENISNMDLPLTLIFNKNRLSKETFRRSIDISLEIGIKNFQFGDGFCPSLNTIEIDEIIKLIGNKCFIKIVGKIISIQKAIEIFNLGVDAIGTSNYHKIFCEIKNN